MKALSFTARAGGGGSLRHSISWGGCAVFLLMFLSGFVFVEPSPYDVLLAIVIVISAFFGFIQVRENIYYPLLFLHAFIIFSLIPFFYAYDLNDSVVYLAITYYLMLSLFFYERIVNVFGYSGITLLALGYVLTCTVGSVASLVSLVIPGPLSEITLYGNPLYGVRLRGFFKDPNVFGPCLVPALLICMLSWRPVFRSRIIIAGRWFLVLLFFITILLAGSRGGWLNLVVALAAFEWHRRRQREWSPRVRRRGLLPIAGLAVVAGVSYAVVTVAGYDAFLSDRFEEKGYDSDRFLAQSLALQEAAANPFGIGPGQSETYEGSVSLLRAPHSPHSLYVRIIAESGWGGAVSFLAFLLLTVRHAWRTAVVDWQYAPVAAVVFASLLGVLANSFFVDTLHWRHFWILLGVTWGLRGLWRLQFAVRRRHFGAAP